MREHTHSSHKDEGSRNPPNAHLSMLKPDRVIIEEAHDALLFPMRLLVVLKIDPHTYTPTHTYNLVSPQSHPSHHLAATMMYNPLCGMEISPLIVR